MGGVTQDRLREALAEGGEDFSGMSVHAGSIAGGKPEAEAKAEGGAGADTEREEGRGEAALSGDGPAEAEGQAPGATCTLKWERQ